MPEPKRILHVIDNFDLGGAQEALMNLVACADRSRFEPEVAAMHGRGVYWERFRALSVPVQSLSPHKLAPLCVWNFLRLLPTREIIDRSKKGFGMPIGRWLGEGKFQLDPSDSAVPLLAPAFITRKANEHRAGRADHRLFLWSYWLFMKWQRP